MSHDSRVGRLLVGALSAALCGVAAAADSTEATIPLASAVAAYFQGGHQYKLAAQSATAPGDRYTLQVDVVPKLSPGTFRDQTPAYSSVQTVTIEKNAAPPSKSVTTVYYLANPFIIIGKTYGEGTPYAVTRNSFELPAAAARDGSGRLYEMTFYHDADMAAVDGFLTGTYAVRAAEGGPGSFCLNDSITKVTAQGTTDGLAVSAETACYRLDNAGRAALVSVDVTINGENLSFK
jgi:hypothetical protein